MADQFAVVSFTTRGTPGTQDITDASITETFSAAIFLIGSTADDTDNQHGLLGLGFCAPNDVDSEESCMAICAEDGIGTSPDTGTRHSINNCIVVCNPTSVASAEFVLAEYSASIAGGVRLNFTTTTISVRVTAILFAGLSRAYTDACASSVVGASEAVGGVTDFEPDAVIFAASDSAVNTAKSDATPNIGFAVNDASVTQVSAYLNAADANDPADADGILRSDDAYLHNNSATPRAATLNESTVHVDAFTATGFDHTSSAETPDAIYLALQFSGSIAATCAHISVAAATGDQTFSIGFQPVLVIGLCSALTTIDSEVNGSTASSSGYFVTGASGTRGYTWHHRLNGSLITAGNPTDANTRHEDAVILYSHDGTIVQRATWVGGSGSGFTMNFSVASAAGTWTILAIGSSSVTSVFNETVGITEGALLRGAITSVFNETVGITEVYQSITNFVLTDRLPAGWTFAGGSERGSVLSGGAEAGSLL